MQASCVASDKALRRFCAPPGLPPIEPERPSIQDADEHWMITDDEGQIRARCSLWWRATPALGTHKTGFIGHYAARHHEPDDHAAAQTLLHHVCRELAAHSCTLAIGPLDGSTFRAYRFVTQRAFEQGASVATRSAHHIEPDQRNRLTNVIDTKLEKPPQPPFFLEPDNPTAWPQHFTSAGFTDFAHYYSARTVLTGPDPRRTELERRHPQLRIRPVDLSGYAAEINRIYDIVCVSFQDNLLYQPITRAEFMSLYAPLQAYIQPELILIAERGNAPIGFIFALPDLAQRIRGEAIDTVILKTVAVVPEAGGTGLGSLLVAICQGAAWRLGFRSAIHALMHEDNISRKISRHYADIIRRYTLFARALAPE